MEIPQREVFIWAPPGKAVVKRDIVATAEPNNFLYYEVPGQMLEKRRYMGIPTPEGQMQVGESYVVMEEPLRRSPRDVAQPMETTPPSSRSSSRGSWKKRYLSPEEEEASQRRRRK
jgi:hypothetical protein